MAKIFEYIAKTKPEDLFGILQNRLKGNDEISFAGDESSGHIAGMGFEGRYSMSVSSSGTKVTLEITRKPFIVPWSIIQSKLDSEAMNW